MSLLGALPSELYSAILNQLPATDVQHTTLALTRAIPRAPIPLHHLFSHVHLCDSQRVVQLHRRLRRAPDDARCVRHLRLEAWTADAEVVVNLLALLGDLTNLTLFIGPNFAPEHVEEMFYTPRARLCYLSLRFRPYSDVQRRHSSVQRATYYQFLKGAYFDSTLNALSSWPASAIPALSIIQDPLDETIAQNHRFAQPLVFFSLEPFTSLSVAPYLSTLTSLRLRVPARKIAPLICALPHALPMLELLDMSTCSVRAVELDALLTRFAQLRHLVLDACGLLRGEPREGEWAALGKACALAGVRRAKERERALKSWLEACRTSAGPVRGQDAAAVGSQQQPPQPQPQPQPEPQPGAPRARAGRRGLAAATISLRRSPPRSAVALPGAPPGGASVLPVSKIRVLPPPPVLQSLSTTGHTTAHADGHAVMRSEFARGWREGLAQLRATWARLRASKANGVRVMRMAADAQVPDDLREGALSEGLRGLVDLSLDDGLDTDGVNCPALCFTGPKDENGHAEGCGHAASWKVWGREVE